MIAPISAFDFDVIQAVMRQIAASGTTAPDTLRQLARTVAEEFCPDEVYPDEMIDSLVQAALAAAEKSSLPE